MAPKKSHQQAIRQAEASGFAIYKGKVLSLSSLGGSDQPKQHVPTQHPARTRRLTSAPHIRYLSWNAGGLTSGTWEELLSHLASRSCLEVSVVVLQETHWRGTSQFTRDDWHVISSGSNGEKGAGVAVLVRKSLCRASSLRYNEVLPGRVLHARIPGEQVSLDVVSVYQHVWRSTLTTEANQQHRKGVLSSLQSLLSHLPSRNTLLVAGDFNSSLIPDGKHVGPCVPKGPKFKLRSVRPLQKLLEDNSLVALNTWASGRPATHRQGSSLSQIDFVVGRQSQSRQLSKQCRPQREFPVAEWREGSRHFPLAGQIMHQRSYRPSLSKPYDVKAMDYDFRTGSGRTEALTAAIDEQLSNSPPGTWQEFNAALHQAAQAVYPKTSATATVIPWHQHRVLSTFSPTLLALLELHYAI